MIIDEYRDGNVGQRFEEFVLSANKNVVNKNDDFVMLIVGTTGTGKSNLGLWVQSLIVPTPKIEQIALTRADLARAIDAELEAPSDHRYIQYDEGKLSRRDWASEWSKELLELYHDVRGLNIFHTWCTAMPNLLDREFIKSRVGCLIFIYTKDIDRPRHFLLFTKTDLLRFLDQNDNISMDTLKKYGKSHASMQSWFKEYTGPMSAAYADKKDARMRERVKQFAKKWGGDTVSFTEVGRLENQSPQTVSNWVTAGLKENFFVLDRDVIINDVGKKELTTDPGLKSYRNYKDIKRSKALNGIFPRDFAFLPQPNQYSNARRDVVELSEADEAILTNHRSNVVSIGNPRSLEPISELPIDDE